MKHGEISAFISDNIRSDETGFIWDRTNQFKKAPSFFNMLGYDR